MPNLSSELALRPALTAAWAGRSPTLSAQQTDQLVIYLEVLLHWNRVHSLTAITDPEAAVHRHLVDALLVWPSLLRQIETTGGPVDLADVGSGTGVPGLPLAIVLPDLRVSLVERVARKAAFLRHVVARLGLTQRVTVVQQDVRDIHPADGYAIIVSRAFAACEDFLDLTLSLSNSKTKWLYMAGKLSEIKGLSQNYSVYRHPVSPDRYTLLAVEAVSGPRQPGERHLIWMGRTE